MLPDLFVCFPDFCISNRKACNLYSPENLSGDHRKHRGKCENRGFSPALQIDQFRLKISPKTKKPTKRPIGGESKKWSGWRDSNSRPFDPQSNALTRLRYIPKKNPHTPRNKTFTVIPLSGIASSFSKKQRFSFHPDENNTPDETSQVHRKIHPPLLSVISCKFTGKKLPPPLLGSQTLRFSGSFRLYVLLLPSKLSRQSTLLPLPFRSKHPRKR